MTSSLTKVTLLHFLECKTKLTDMLSPSFCTILDKKIETKAVFYHFLKYGHKRQTVNALQPRGCKFVAFARQEPFKFSSTSTQRNNPCLGQQRFPKFWKMAMLK